MMKTAEQLLFLAIYRDFSEGFDTKVNHVGATSVVLVYRMQCRKTNLGES